MDIRSIINEEIADYIKRLDSQREDVKKAVESYEDADDEEQKLQKGIDAEEAKQKLYKLEAEFLKEKIEDSKKTKEEYRAKIAALRSSGGNSESLSI